MLRFSFPIGRIMGVDLRLHLSFFVLLVGAIVYGAAYGNPFRGVGLFAALAFAVLVRESARAIAAAYVGLRLRAIFLFPVGGVMAMAPQEPAAQAGAKALVLAAPLANFGMGLLLLGMGYACAPGVTLLQQPWITPSHILRSFVWMQFVLGLVNLLPTATLSTRQMLRGGGAKGTTPSTRDAGPAFGLLALLAAAMVFAGLLTSNLWVMLLGCFALLGSQLVSPEAAAGTAAAPDSIRVEEVMLTEFTILSSSDTLRGALARTLHSAQEVFPVLRGNRLVGSVTRQRLSEQLQAGGDSYVQGTMTRGAHLAQPREPLVSALRRAGAQGASEFIPVAEEGRMLGMLTPQSLARAVQQVKQARPPVEAPRD